MPTVLLCAALLVWGSVAVADVTGRAAVTYNLTKIDGKWTGDYVQRITLNTSGQTGLGRLLGLSFGLARQNDRMTFLSGLAPTYALTLRGRHYNLASAYAVRMSGGVVNTRLYENATINLPKWPRITGSYTKLGLRGTRSGRAVEVTTDAREVRAVKVVGPFRLAMNRRETSARSGSGESQRLAKTSATYGNVDFTYAYQGLLSLMGRYRGGESSAERGPSQTTKSKTRDVSVNVAVRPTSTITFSGSTMARRETRMGLSRGTSSEFIANRIQLMLRPLDGLRVDGIYSTDASTRSATPRLSNESRYVKVDVQPWPFLSIYANWAIHDARSDQKKLTQLVRQTIDVRANAFRDVTAFYRVDISSTVDHRTGTQNDRIGWLTRIEATLTDNARTDIRYGRQKLRRHLGQQVAEDARSQWTIRINYSMPNVLSLDLTVSGNRMSTESGIVTGVMTYGLVAMAGGSFVRVRYHRVRESFPAGRARTSLVAENAGTSSQRVLSLSLGQRIGRRVDFRVNYESRHGTRVFGLEGSKRVEFSSNIRF